MGFLGISTAHSIPRKNHNSKEATDHHPHHSSPLSFFPSQNITFMIYSSNFNGIYECPWCDFFTTGVFILFFCVLHVLWWRKSMASTFALFDKRIPSHSVLTEKHSMLASPRKMRRTKDECEKKEKVTTQPIPVLQERTLSLLCYPLFLAATFGS